LRAASYAPQLFLENYQDFYLGFTLTDAEEGECDFDIPKIVQVNFYAMAANDMSGDMAEALKWSMVDYFRILAED